MDKINKSSTNKRSEECLVAHVDAVEDCGVVFDLENDSPVMEVAEMASFDLSPIKPIVVAVLLCIDVLQLRMFEFLVVFLFAEREH